MARDGTKPVLASLISSVHFIDNTYNASYAIYKYCVMIMTCQYCTLTIPNSVGYRLVGFIWLTEGTVYHAFIVRIVMLRKPWSKGILHMYKVHLGVFYLSLCKWFFWDFNSFHHLVLFKLCNFCFFWKLIFFQGLQLTGGFWFMYLCYPGCWLFFSVYFLVYVTVLLGMYTLLRVYS